MVHEFVATLRQRDWQIVEAEGNPLEQAVPYALLKKLVQSALQAENLTLADYVGSSEDPTPAHADLWPAALNSVLDQPVRDPRWRDLEPLLRRRVIIDAVRSMLDRVVSSRPTVLLLEDLHWIDGQSETVVEALMSLATSRPLLVLLTWRTEYTPDWLEGLDVLRIWLRSLDAASANALLDNLLGTAANLDALKARILRHTGQIPLFIEEVARQLIGRRVAGGARGILGHPRNPSHRSGSHRVAHRSLVERRQGASAARFGSRTAHIAASARRRDRDADSAIAKSALVAGDSGFP